MHRIFLLILLLVIVPHIGFSAEKTISIPPTADTGKVFSKAKQISKSDSLVVKLMSLDRKKEKSQFEGHMPWIAAIVVGLLTVFANFIINWQLRRLNRESLDKQLSNLKQSTELQISSSKEIALAQIENSRRNAQVEFNKTVLSGNRQAWINDLRSTISTILSKSFSIGVRGNMTHEELRDLKFLISKTELMLNAEKDKFYIDTLTELDNCLIGIINNKKSLKELTNCLEKVKKETQKTLKSEWERVKKGE